jgi:hypothetical protein
MHEILHDPMMYIARLTVFCADTCDSCPGVHGGYQAGNFIDVFRGNAVTGRHGAQQGLLGKLAHSDGVLDRSTLPMQRGMTHTAPHGNDIKVETGGEAPVQPHFFLTVETAFLQCRKIKKSEIDGFLDFVGELASEDYPRDVCLDQADVTDRMVKRGRILQGAYQRHLVLRHIITPVDILPDTGSQKPPLAVHWLQQRCIAHPLPIA